MFLRILGSIEMKIIREIESIHGVANLLVIPVNANLIKMTSSQFRDQLVFRQRLVNSYEN